MRRLTAVSVLVAVLVPPLLAVSALRVVTNDWIVAFEYDHGGVPADRYGLTRDERERLALVGLDAIRPGGPGVQLLRDARLPGGEPAFNEREMAHMQDVRDAVGIAFTFHTTALAALLVAAVVLGRRAATRAVVPLGLWWGGLGTLGVAAVAGVLMLFAWDGFFEGFHGVFFSGDTWRFPSSDTLIRLYPDAFWMGVGAWIAGLAVTLAVLTGAAGRLWLRRLRPAEADPAASAFAGR